MVPAPPFPSRPTSNESNRAVSRRWSPLRDGLRVMTVVALLACGTGTLFAKPVPVPFQSDHLAEIWGLEEGFPENSCSGIVVGSDDYLWLSTFRGLVRFNGQDFKAWAPPEMPNLKSTGIISMYRD